MEKKIVIIGAGGHAGVVKDVIESDGRYAIAGVIDARFAKGSLWKDGIYSLGGDEELEHVFEAGVGNVAIGIGQNAQLRFKIYSKLKKIGFKFPTLVHASAIISDSATIDEGTIIMPVAVINCYAKIGKFGIINTAAIVEHDCRIGENVHVAPGACVLGGVSIGNNSHVGAKAVIIQSRTVGENVIIGAGAVVTKDVSKESIIVGVPARSI
ncbi:acetyltransferase [Candidatus Epulonipiscium viviparus]|uniref:acetyltransferase n=1 Tax=Candidatus Epulonipiscium viviparus TaxID=420336 RepID=UPI002738169B|nr:acetyltransferase [Candidatus Epulopiscium viviparus]